MMIRQLAIPLVTSVGLVAFLASVQFAHSGPSLQGAKSPVAITKKTAIRRLKRIPIIKAAIHQAETFVGTKNCVFEFQKLRELTQYTRGSAFEYRVLITCSSKNEEGESQAYIEIEGQSLNHGHALQDIERLSFQMAG